MDIEYVDVIINRVLIITRKGKHTDMLIKVNTRQVAALPYLTRLVLRSAYERKTMRKDELALMEDSIVGWAKKVNLTENDRYVLQRMGKFLLDDQNGKFALRKELFIKKNISWRKFHRYQGIK